MPSSIQSARLASSKPVADPHHRELPERNEAVRARTRHPEQLGRFRDRNTDAMTSGRCRANGRTTPETSCFSDLLIGVPAKHENPTRTHGTGAEIAAITAPEEQRLGMDWG